MVARSYFSAAVIARRTYHSYTGFCVGSFYLLNILRAKYQLLNPIKFYRHSSHPYTIPELSGTAESFTPPHEREEFTYFLV